MAYAEARQIGLRSGLAVLGVTPDGREVAADSEGIVVEQDPQAGTALRGSRRITVRVGRPPGGSKDRVPQPIEPLPRQAREQPDQVLGRSPGPVRGAGGDDPELVPV